jgi:hypothetical protein
MAAGEDVAPADDEGVLEGVALGDFVTGGSGITGLGSLRYRACWSAAADEGAGDEGAGDEGAGDEGAGDEGAGDEGAGDEGAGDDATGYDGAGEGTFDAPADVGPGGTGFLHVVPLVPA